MAIFRFDPEVHRLETDSRDYEVLFDAVDNVVAGPYLALELGVRAGGSAQAIMERLAGKTTETVFVALDSYGGMPQVHADDDIQILDYTNQMRNKAIASLMFVAQTVGLNFIFMNLRDTEYFKRYSDGVPVYDNSEAKIYDKYNFVFLDGPHSTELVLGEAKFFSPRCISGAIMVFDDIPNYRHQEIEDWLIENGWEILKKANNKASYRKI